MPMHVNLILTAFHDSSPPHLSPAPLSVDQFINSCSINKSKTELCKCNKQIIRGEGGEGKAAGSGE